MSGFIECWGCGSDYYPNQLKPVRVAMNEIKLCQRCIDNASKFSLGGIVRTKKEKAKEYACSEVPICK